ncbi:MAG: hypothetical protein Q8L85_10530 [Alphaproteobacteria bacterium]|nr:hypothetical protein [Alphaproteobacteria bacterium]
MSKFYFLLAVSIMSCSQSFSLTKIELTKPTTIHDSPVGGKIHVITPDNVKELLEIHHKANGHCVTIKNIGDKGGSFTSALYHATIPAGCGNNQEEKKVIIKQLATEDEEVTNLEAVQSHAHLQKSQLAKGININLPEGIYKTQNTTENGKKVRGAYVSIMPEATGKPLKAILDEKDPNKTKEAFEAYGKMMALHHQKNMDHHSKPGSAEEAKLGSANNYKTYTHGDAHWDNAFYDSHKKEITLIDNETMANDGVIIKRNIAADISKATDHSSKFVGGCQDNQAVKASSSKCEESVLASSHFLKSYIANYPIEERPHIKSYIKTILGKNTGQMTKAGQYLFNNMLNSL